MELKSNEKEEKMIDSDFDYEQFHKYMYRNLSRLKGNIWKFLYRKEYTKDHFDFRKQICKTNNTIKNSI